MPPRRSSQVGGRGGVPRVIRSAQKSKERKELYATPVDPGSETSGQCRPEAKLAALRAQGSEKLVSFCQYGRERTEQAVTTYKPENFLEFLFQSPNKKSVLASVAFHLAKNLSRLPQLGSM